MHNVAYNAGLHTLISGVLTGIYMTALVPRRCVGAHRGLQCRAAHLDFGGADGHTDDSAGTEALRSKGHALRVVARTRADDARGQLLRCEADHFVERATQLEREHGLQVLALEEDRVAGKRAQTRGQVQGALDL